MQRRQCLRWSLGLVGATLSGQLFAQKAGADAAGASDKLVWRQRALIGFGTTLWLKAGHSNADQLDAALTAAVNAIRGVERQMSLFDPNSAVSRLNAQGSLRQPDAQLLSVLKLAGDVSARSGGAFDISMQPLWQTWSQAAAQGDLPTQREVQRAKALVTWRAVETSASIVRLNQPGMGVSLNGIAQGYASDLARATLQAHGIAHAMLDVGETTTLGHAPTDKPWSFEIEPAVAAAATGKITYTSSDPSGKMTGQAPAPVLVSDGRAMATSSDAHTAFSADHLHHHIVNPETGYSPLHWSSVTVIAPRCVLADALTKVFFMLPPSQVLAAARRWEVDVVLQDKAGKWIASPGARMVMPPLA